MSLAKGTGGRRCLVKVAAAVLTPLVVIGITIAIMLPKGQSVARFGVYGEGRDVWPSASTMRMGRVDAWCELVRPGHQL